MTPSPGLARPRLLASAGDVVVGAACAIRVRLGQAGTSRSARYGAASYRAELAPDQRRALNCRLVVLARDGGADVPGTSCGGAVSARR